MVTIGLALLLFVLLPLAAFRFGADSRPSLGSPPERGIRLL